MRSLDSMTESEKTLEMVKDRGAWRTVVHEVTELDMT